MSHPSMQTRSSSLGFLFREGTALILAGLIWYAIWGGYEPKLATPEQAFGSALLSGLIALFYVAIQALAVVTSPLGRVSRYLMDLILSLVPLAFVGYAAALHMSGYLPLTLHQKGVLWFGGAACFIDVVLFTWFNMKVNRLSSDVVLMR